jgi:hypothetical protein
MSHCYKLYHITYCHRNYHKTFYTFFQSFPYQMGLEPIDLVTELVVMPCR